MDLDSVSEELYSLPPAEFTATRNARSAAARSAGDKTLAAGITSLRKPSATAWLANQLVRQRPDQLRPLLELGAALREATATLSGVELRELGRQRHLVIRALVQEARAVAAGCGISVSTDSARGLEDTLNAALADEEAARLLGAARLTAGLEHSGFTPDTGGRPAPRTEPGRPVDLGERRNAQLEAARQEEDEAREATGAAQARRDELQQQLRDGQESLETAEQLAERLREQLDAAKRSSTEAERSLRQLRTELERADRGARRAVERLEEATARRRRLEPA